MVYYANLNPEHISWNSIFYEALQLIRFYISYNRFYGEYSEVYAWNPINLAGDSWYRRLMLYEQNNKYRRDEYILSNVQCLYGKRRLDEYTLSRVKCLYNKNRRNAYTLGNAKCLYGKHRLDEYTLSQVQCLYIKRDWLCSSVSPAPQLQEVFNEGY